MAASPVPFLSTVADLRARVRAWRSAGETLALVPTMGALHSGHLELVKLAQTKSRRVVVSIFVNPTQFAPHEDLDRYPRTFEADLAQLATVDCDLVWAPTVSAMYPEGFATRIAPEGAAKGLETDFRPHFFGGVTTVCAKLFLQVAPDVAIFGEKDYQQLAVIRQMVRDLDMPLEIVGAPTVREADGLAMSSRNRYLSPDERARAPAIHRALTALAASAGTEKQTLTPTRVGELETRARDAILSAGFHKVDYVALRDAVTLDPIDKAGDRPLRVLAAAWIGKTRLIDNTAA